MEKFMLIHSNAVFICMQTCMQNYTAVVQYIRMQLCPSYVVRLEFKKIIKINHSYSFFVS